MEVILTSKEELKKVIEESVQKVLSELSFNRETKENKSILTLKEASKYLNLAPQTIYQFTSKRLIPFIKKGKKLHFNKADLEKWLLEGTKRSVAEMEKEISENGTLKF